MEDWDLGDGKTAPDGIDFGDSPLSAFFVKGSIRLGADYADDARVLEYVGRGYVQPTYFLPRSVHGALVSALVDALGESPNPDTVRAVGHVWIVGALRFGDAGGFVPLPWQVRARDVPYADFDTLVLAGVLSYVPGCEGGPCSLFAVAGPVASALDATLARAPLDEAQADLFTGRRRRGRQPGNQKHDDSRNLVSPPTAAAMDAVSHGIVNRPALEAHLDRLRVAIAVARTPEEREKARARWLNDKLCATWIFGRDPELTQTPGIYTYPHAWKAQSTGRIMPRKSGGPQGMSRAGKAAMYSGIEGVRNYDLRSSQPRTVQAALKALGIPCPWLDAYLADPEAKSRHAARCGVEVDTWKAVFNAAMTAGAVGVPVRFRTRRTVRYVAARRVELERPATEAMKAVSDDVGCERAPEVWLRVRAELEGFLEAVRAWHLHLGEWAVETAMPGRSGHYLTNAVGASLDIAGLNPRELPRKVAAFVLQGKEALYTHTLCAIGERYGFRVVCHEHDGVVTLGEVPEAAMAEAGRVAEMLYAELDEKPFVVDASSQFDWQERRAA